MHRASWQHAAKTSPTVATAIRQAGTSWGGQLGTTQCRMRGPMGFAMTRGSARASAFASPRRTAKSAMWSLSCLFASVDGP
eukprot:15448018-Alexandrium_andersonii.AAC.1